MKTTYTQSPRPYSGPISFVLKGDRLTVDSVRKVHEVRLDAVESVRLTYEPGRLGRKAFRTKVTMRDGKSFGFTSVTWRSLIEAEEQAEDYAAFSRTLCAAIAKASPNARFSAGKPAWIWTLTTLVAMASFATMAVLIWRALQMGATSVALAGALFAVIGIWQIEPMLRLNKPRPFKPDALPRELLPGTA